ncbi:hypothetical protein [Corallococcus exercitus]|uniref:hypothetical protein n=1 Tax=Corallococcus exercitus TaxID=2316736 RepID=UPI0011C44046|nr:hypothetical protein [Corallococcus exercitus]
MRYVDIDELVMPSGWLSRAGAAALAVLAGDDPNNHSIVWRDLKDGLASLLGDKCWYCESWIDRSDNAVDHFRPKNSVSDAIAPHKGYRWLAFDHLNYRYSCTFCNSRRKGIDDATVGGKADRFPLLDEAKRLYAPGPLAQEQPTLLDPCELHDWELLGCQQENGQPCATSFDPIKRLRAETSIEIYHLHYEPTCKVRHRTAVQLISDIEEAKRLFIIAQTSPARERDFSNMARRIKRAIIPKAPFSGDMIFLLRGQRSAEHPWIQQLLES